MRNRTGPSADPVIQEYRRRLDMTLVRKSLRLTVKDRFERLEQMALLQDELRRAVGGVRNQK